MQNSIIIKGAREYNIKNINVTIPRDRLVVITRLKELGKALTPQIKSGRLPSESAVYFVSSGEDA